jgi:hypothetical protein
MKPSWRGPLPGHLWAIIERAGTNKPARTGRAVGAEYFQAVHAATPVRCSGDIDPATSAALAPRR